MKYTGTSTGEALRASCHVYCIKHENFLCYMCFTSRRPLTYVNITRKELYDFYILHACNVENGILVYMHVHSYVGYVHNSIIITDLLEQVSVKCLSFGPAVWPGLRSSLKAFLSSSPTSSCPLFQPLVYTPAPIRITEKDIVFNGRPSGSNVLMWSLFTLTCYRRLGFVDTT